MGEKLLYNTGFIKQLFLLLIIYSLLDLQFESIYLGKKIISSVCECKYKH